MADLVREILEKMVPPLRELQRNDIFSEAEISSIVDRREDFEYGLKKRQVDKVGFWTFCSTFVFCALTSQLSVALTFCVMRVRPSLIR